MHTFFACLITAILVAMITAIIVDWLCRYQAVKTKQAALQEKRALMEARDWYKAALTRLADSTYIYPVDYSPYGLISREMLKLELITRGEYAKNALLQNPPKFNFEEDD